MDLFGPVNQCNELNDPYPNHLDVSAVLIPYWIQQAFDRNKLDYMNVLNYNSIRGILSIEDIAQLIYCNSFKDHSVLKTITNYSDLVYKWRSKMTPANLCEFDAVILPLSSSEPICKAVIERLSNEVSSYPTPNIELFFEGLHRIQQADDETILITIKQGLLNAFDNRDYVKRLVSDYLKVLYSLLPIREVSKHYRVFELYFELL